MSRTRVWPIGLRRCAECRGLIWPWQAVGIFDPEDSSLKHHHCHHLYAEWLAAECGEANWREWTWCEHRERAAA